MKSVSPLNQAPILSLKNKRTDFKDPKQREELLDAAKMYEKQFLREMVKQMRATVPESELIPKSMGEKIYQDSIDSEYVENWGEKGGIGLADMVYKQILLQMGLDEKGNRQPIRPIGPVPMENMKGVRKANQPALPLPQGPKKDVQFEIEIDTKGKATSLVAPWKGQVVAKQNLPTGQDLIIINHENKLQSKLLVTGGLTSQLSPQDQVQEGQKIGILNPSATHLTWQIS